MDITNYNCCRQVIPTVDHLLRLGKHDDVMEILNELDDLNYVYVLYEYFDLFPQYKQYTSVLEKNMYRLSNLTESVDKTWQDKVPLYIILTYTGTLMSNMIKAVTKQPFSHISIALDDSLTKMYSFGRKEYGDRMTFVEEDINKGIYKENDVQYSMYVTFVNKDVAKALQAKLDEFKNKADNLSFNMRGFLGFFINKPVEKQDSYFCSEFVSKTFEMFKIARPSKHSALTTPSDFAKVKGYYFVSKGKFKNYSNSKVNSRVKELSKNSMPLKESLILNELFKNKDTKIELDKDGALIIEKQEKSDLHQMYMDSHRLLMEYKKSGNIEGMKYELCKMYYMISIIESKYMYAKGVNKIMNSGKVEKAMKTRAFLINDFKTYMKIVLEHDKDFNFETYYKDSPFGKYSYKIDAHTIESVKDLIKVIIKL